MIERAAKALWEVGAEDAPPWPPCDLDREGMRQDAQAALLAALDDEDDALLAALTDAPTFGKLDVIDAKIIIGLIKAHAQGGSAP